uniref:Ribosome biogenesis protein NOP53 n=1 Tax=Riptortus pedestris TaxID=329032 RepID=R4WD13_RIPPE|nr:conserved hypothetical protein [Riptortus pedestris]
MELVEKSTKKKKKISKKNKKSWAKHIDNKDVEEFLDQQRLQERLGGPFSEKKDTELFVIDDVGSEKKSQKKLSKKERARLPLKCYGNLVNNCKIPDPVGRRTRVKTKEERKCRIRKSIEEAQRKNGIIPHKVLQSYQDRIFTLRKKKSEPKELIFEKDVWEEDKGVFGDADTAWLKTETIRHHAGTLKVSVPKDITKKKSVLPAVEPPHPGMSYNPTLKAHQDLLNIVAEKELEKVKEEAHIDRVTTQMFKKVTRQQKEAEWIEEMSQGLETVKDENEEPATGPLSYNPPTSFLNKKTLKQRRKQKEQKEAALARKYAKMEKKKKADISKMRFILKDIDDKEKKEELAAQIRKKKEELKVFQTKRLAAKKFVEADLEFNRKSELKGNLRSIKTGGNLLADRFYSLQKRNILAPSSKVTKFKKTKVKRFTKPSHKMEAPPTISRKKKKK